MNLQDFNRHLHHFSEIFFLYKFTNKKIQNTLYSEQFTFHIKVVITINGIQKLKCSFLRYCTYSYLFMSHIHSPVTRKHFFRDMLEIRKHLLDSFKYFFLVPLYMHMFVCRMICDCKIIDIVSEYRLLRQYTFICIGPYQKKKKHFFKIFQKYYIGATCVI